MSSVLIPLHSLYFLLCFPSYLRLLVSLLIIFPCYPRPLVVATLYIPVMSYPCILFTSISCFPSYPCLVVSPLVIFPCYPRPLVITSISASLRPWVHACYLSSVSIRLAVFACSFMCVCLAVSPDTSVGHACLATHTSHTLYFAWRATALLDTLNGLSYVVQFRALQGLASIKYALCDIQHYTTSLCRTPNFCVKTFLLNLGCTDDKKKYRKLDQTNKKKFIPLH